MNLRKVRVRRQGSSLYMALPPDWVRGHGLEPGDEIVIAYDGHLRVKVAPKEEG
jgi:antitoxin component of MazEF toxin-antitoxin module